MEKGDCNTTQGVNMHCGYQQTGALGRCIGVQFRIIRATVHQQA